MWEFDDTLKLKKINLLGQGFDAYCLFTLTGQEEKLANELNEEYEYCLATPLMKMAHRSRMGEKYDIQEVFLSSYVFLYLPKDKDIKYVRSKRQYYFKVLSRNNDDGKLFGSDLEYAKWVMDVNGILSVSEAIKIDGKVKIVNGPLKQLEGSIVEYSKKNRNCCIEIDFLGQKTRAWLPFEWIDFDNKQLNTK